MGSFANRYEAGRRLAKHLLRFGGRDDVLVLGLARGGVPVASEIARTLGVPFDVFVVRKLGVPCHQELAMGAVGSGGARVINRDVIEALHIHPSTVARVIEAELKELERRERAYRDARPYPAIADNVVIAVDDGAATGASMLAAIGALRERAPARVVVAVPVASEEAYALFRRWADEVACEVVPSDFNSVGFWYDDFSQIDDLTVRNLLRLAPGSA
jgi:putative phosphoribosyl transferase